MPADRSHCQPIVSGPQECGPVWLTFDDREWRAAVMSPRRLQPLPGAVAQWLPAPLITPRRWRGASGRSSAPVAAARVCAA
ncbi:DUF6767 domain-containing protein [Micromonospora sp. NPDC050397]|uniref:DUF6767 domain-containing protein n=1 Tax=Micromonospora sp. NPDC050397 TaxID=3364279 RepID=UPI00384D771B